MKIETRQENSYSCISLKYNKLLTLTMNEEDIKIPGTIHLVDLEGTLDVRHDGEKDIVLVPQPTEDPEDPLNWSKNRKRLLALSLMIAVFSADILSTSLSAVLLTIEADTGIPLANLNTGVGIQYLFFGWSTLLWQPFGLTYGRRPALLLGGLGVLLCTVWSAYVKSSGEWYVNRLLTGTFYGPIETLIEVCISDVFFAHERGTYIAWYCWVLFSIPFACGVPAGFVASNLGWRWIPYICCIIAAACLIFMFFFLEETMYYRDPALELDGTDVISISENENMSSTEEKGKNADVDVAVDEVVDSTRSPALVYQRKTYAQKLKFWGARDSKQRNVFFQSMWIPFSLIRFPSIAFGGMVVGSVLSWFNVVNATIAVVLAAPPYNFSGNMIGVFFAAPFIGISVGAFFSGKIVDTWTTMRARNARGFREPEERLWLSVVPMVTHPLGCFLFGIGAAHGIHWVGLAFGLAFVCATFPMGSAVAINYIIDCYKEVSGDGLVTMILIRNSLGFGFSYAVTPWLDAVGVQNLFIAIGCLGVFFWGLSFAVIVFGKKMRKGTAKSYWRFIAKYGLKAH
ncbi:unnamed protein product [Kuraishia capsulata CBS 1993]|uniref:Major facilitator superfamily (MFS) profile domain-containing protein n=1 Tax=Kuraishia capsulata CBS 1993 TaxID=1382522 RepID=W6MVV5_9ASCO|nr:uncharacterized protein KUCA_T00002552001 [Kuraishia capsulata CBS 1993]CDK26580.1 unnamed protein product [Kuraishia capsulata CBS 1993]